MEETSYAPGLPRLQRAGEDCNHLVRSRQCPEEEMRRPPTGAALRPVSRHRLPRWWLWPAAGFPLLAKNCGARLVIINNEPTDQDDIADLVIRHDIGRRSAVRRQLMPK